MFVIVITRQSSWAPFTEGLSQGLKTYGERSYQNQMKQREEAATAKGLQQLGYTEKEASGVAMLPPNLRETGIAIAKQ